MKTAQVFLTLAGTCLALTAGPQAKPPAAVPPAGAAKKPDSAVAEGKGPTAAAPAAPESHLNSPPPRHMRLQDQTLFTPTGDWVFTPLAREGQAIARNSEPRPILIDAPTPGSARGFRSFRNGSFWEIRSFPSTDPAAPASLCAVYHLTPTVTQSGWERSGSISTSNGIPNFILPLDREGWYLAVAPFFGFNQDGKASMVGLYREQEGHFTFQELVELPFGDQDNIVKLGTENLAAEGAEPRLFPTYQVSPASLTPNLWLPAILPGHLVLSACQAGVLWFLSLKDGRCQRTVDLGEVERRDLPKLGFQDDFVLGAVPGKDGQLVVATRHPDTLTFAASLISQPGAPDEVAKAAKARFAEVVQGLTAVQWWSIDPESGSKTRLERPDGVPETLPYNLQSRLVFLVGPSGRIRFGPGSRGALLEELGKPKAKAGPEPAPAKAGPEPAPAKAGPEPAPAKPVTPAHP